MSSSFFFTRREFLKSTAVVGMGMALPSFLTQSVSAASAGGAALPGFKDDRVLVVIQLGGGNDGLNTVVPAGNDTYFKSRPRIAVPKGELLKLNDDLALHQSLKPLKELYDNGGLAIVNGTGYPNPDRSHFRSMEIWHTAVDSDRVADTGWIGRYFDNCCDGKPLPEMAVNVGNDTPQAFDGKRGAGVSFSDPSMFRWREGGFGDTKEAFRGINKAGDAHDDDGHTIDFLRNVTANAVIASDKVLKASSIKRQKPEYPKTRLARQLENIATMIAGGLQTRIYYTSISGFDTHANQQNGHARLLGEFAGATQAFMRDIKAIGAEDRVAVMCFSEFGRRVKENASGGTDHGTAGPMFLLGRNIVPGLHGKYPDLDDLDDGDLRHSVDFRSIYAELLGKWFHADPALVMAGKFPPVGVVKG